MLTVSIGPVSHFPAGGLIDGYLTLADFKHLSLSALVLLFSTFCSPSLSFISSLSLFTVSSLSLSLSLSVYLSISHLGRGHFLYFFFFPLVPDHLCSILSLILISHPTPAHSVS